MFGLPVKTVAIVAAVLAVLAALGVASRAIYNAGVNSERVAIVERSLDRTAQRNKDDEEIRNSDLDGLCREYGAKRWVSAQNRCE